jgi:hypothetical protein
MRVLGVVFLLVSLGSVACSNNAPSNTTGTGDGAAPAALQPASFQPEGTLVQVMRSILFPSSNFHRTIPRTARLNAIVSF